MDLDDNTKKQLVIPNEVICHQKIISQIFHIRSFSRRAQSGNQPHNKTEINHKIPKQIIGDKSVVNPGYGTRRKHNMRTKSYDHIRYSRRAQSGNLPHKINRNKSEDPKINYRLNISGESRMWDAAEP